MSRRVAALAASLALCACAQWNPQLARVDEQTGYRFGALESESGRDDDTTFVVVTLSGGGTRAAALGYGVLEALRDMPIGGGRTLLDEVDLISSVSGGSFAAAYLGLFGTDRFFAAFRKDVLYRDLEVGLLLRILAPWNWPRLLSPRFSRSDLAAEYYDSAIFENRNFDAMPRRRPFIVLNATDITLGARFGFTQESFDRFCSDLGPVPVALGVTASSAFPVAFPPLTLQSWPKESCGYRLPESVELAQNDYDVAPQRWALARTWRSYGERDRAWIHLSDGGIADNIGLRAVDESVVLGTPPHILSKASTGEIKHLIVIAVDAMPRGEPKADASPRAPGFITVLDAAASKPMENYSSDTVQRVRDWFAVWDAASKDYDHARASCEATTAACTVQGGRSCRQRVGEVCREKFGASEQMKPPHPELSLIHVRFDSIPGDEVRERLQTVPTRLRLPREDVDELIRWGHRLFEQSMAREGLADRLRR